MFIVCGLVWWYNEAEGESSECYAFSLFTNSSQYSSPVMTLLARITFSGQNGCHSPSPSGSILSQVQVRLNNMGGSQVWLILLGHSLVVYDKRMPKRKSQSLGDRVVVLKVDISWHYLSWLSGAHLSLMVMMLRGRESQEPSLFFHRRKTGR